MIDLKTIEEWRCDADLAKEGHRVALDAIRSEGAEAILALLADREEMLAWMTEHRWAPVRRGDVTTNGCVECGRTYAEGCDPDCRLAALLKPEARTVPK